MRLDFAKAVRDFWLEGRTVGETAGRFGLTKGQQAALVAGRVGRLTLEEFAERFGRVTPDMRHAESGQLMRGES